MSADSRRRLRRDGRSGFALGWLQPPLANYARGSISGGAVDYQMAEPAGVGMQIYGALTRLAHLAHIENCCVFDP